MGVHGLATYLRENQRKLSTPLVLSQERSKSEATIPLVVDGWSFIYELHNQSRLPWVYGGEPVEFRDLVTQVVRAWISVGLRPNFVFDGPYHRSKFATSTIRVEQSTIQPSLLFFRTSSLSRASPRFLRENSILPPLYYVATLDALRSLGGAVQIYMADDEGDPFAVELAGRLRGYVTGRDSDYVILNVEGYAGYIPMDQMVWSTDSQGKEEESQMQDDAGFVVSQRNKAKKQGSDPHAQGIISPDTNDALSLSCVVYTPRALAVHLQIPLSLLPLLSALIGNDFTADRRSTSKLFYERNMTAPQRITRVASVLKSVAAAASGKSPKKARHQITGVVDFVDLAIESLLIRPAAMGPGEREGIVEKTVEAALRYAMPKNQDGDRRLKEPTSSCALHDAESCPLVGCLSRPVSDPSTSTENENVSWERIRSLYISAYRLANFSPGLMDILSTGTAWPELFLENPDLETVVRSLGRPIREWVYALLDDGTGLLGGDIDTGGNGLEESTVNEESDEDEVIDVYSDPDEDMGTVNPLAPLQGALEKLSTGTTIPPSTVTSSVAPTSRRALPGHVIEHTRRGTRHVEEPVSVPTLATLLSAHGFDFAKGSEPLPVQLWDEDPRLNAFLRALGSDMPLVKALPPEQLMAAVSLRWIVRRLADRADEAGPSTQRQREKWTIKEGQAFLASFSWPSLPNCSTSVESGDTPLEDRSIQLTAQILATFDAIEMLCQSLLLTSRVPNRTYLFSGKAFHRCLAGNGENIGARIPSGLWDACVGGLDGKFARGKEGSTAKNPKSTGKGGRASANTPAFQRVPGQSIFDVLSGLGGDT
ncbi:PIN domain-like protein [Lactarius hengduanensis]|nr:PIN domain-like protein [Lactarius hengduanensis]